MTEQATPASEIKSNAGWSIFLGVLIVALGVFLLAYPSVTGVASVLTLGIILVAVAIVEFVLAFRFKSASDFFLKLFAAVIYGITGYLLLAYPGSGLQGLTLFVGAMLLVQGIILAVLGFRAESNIRGWLLFDSAATIIISLLILAHWPSSSVWAVGTLVGVEVIVRGATRIATSMAVRRTAGVIDQRFRPAA